MSYRQQTKEATIKANKLSDAMTDGIRLFGGASFYLVKSRTICALIDRGIVTTATAETQGKHLLTAKGTLVHQDLGFGDPLPEATAVYVKANTVVYEEGDAVECPARPDLGRGIVKQTSNSKYGQRVVVQWSDSPTWYPTNTNGLVLVERAAVERAADVTVEPKPVCAECRMPGSHKMNCYTGRYNRGERPTVRPEPEVIVERTSYRVQVSENGGSTWRDLTGADYRQQVHAVKHAQELRDRAAGTNFKRYRVVELREISTVIDSDTDSITPAKAETDPRYVVRETSNKMGFHVVDTMSDFVSGTYLSRYTATDVADRWNKEIN